MMNPAIDLLAWVTASSSSSDNSSFGLIFLTSGFVFYAAVFLRYRNVGKRHHYETETEAKKVGLTQVDEKIESLTGLRNARMTGANNTSLEGAGSSPLGFGDLTSMAEKLTPMIEKLEQSTGKGPKNVT